VYLTAPVQKYILYTLFKAPVNIHIPFSITKLQKRHLQHHSLQHILHKTWSIWEPKYAQVYALTYSFQINQSWKPKIWKFQLLKHTSGPCSNHGTPMSSI